MCRSLQTTSRRVRVPSPPHSTRTAHRSGTGVLSPVQIRRPSEIPPLGHVPAVFATCGRSTCPQPRAHRVQSPVLLCAQIPSTLSPDNASLSMCGIAERLAVAGRPVHNADMTHVQNPWLYKPRQAPYVLLRDKPVVDRWNASLSPTDPRGIELHVLPEPVLGSTRCARG